MIVVEEDLTNHVKECDVMKADKDATIAEAKQLALDLKEAQFQTMSVREELKQASEIASRKPYLM